MAGETVITVIGNLTGDPELRFTPSGAAVASFTVAATPRNFDRDSNSWKDGDPLFLRCSVWRQYAENVAESLTKGMQVMVQGVLKQRSYQTREGENRTIVELDVQDIGPTLRFATARVTKASRSSGGDSSGWAPAQTSAQRGGNSNGAASAADDPWSTDNPGGGWGAPPSGEPPF